MNDRHAEFMNARRAAIAAARLLFPLGEVDAEEGAKGGCANLPPYPAIRRRETQRVAGDSGDFQSQSAEQKAGSDAMLGGKSVQVWLWLADGFAIQLCALPPGRRALALWLALEGRIGSALNLPLVISSVAELWRIGVLLNQSCRYIVCKPEDSASLLGVVQEAVRAIRKLRPPSQVTEVTEESQPKSSSSAGSPAGSLGRWEAKPSGESVQLRLRLPRDFADLLIQLSPHHRREALRLALDHRINDEWDLIAVISSASELRETRWFLNQFCQLFGAGEGDPELLVSAVTEVVEVINRLHSPLRKTKKKAVLK
jgi:hypothetical protein